MLVDKRAPASALAYTVLLIAVVSGLVMASGLAIRSDYSIMSSMESGKQAEQMAKMGLQEARSRLDPAGTMLGIGDIINGSTDFLEYGTTPLNLNNYDDFLGDESANQKYSYILKPRARGFTQLDPDSGLRSWNKDAEALPYVDFSNLDQEQPYYKMAIHRFAMVTTANMPAGQRVAYTFQSQELPVGQEVVIQIRKLPTTNGQIGGQLILAPGVAVEARVNGSSTVQQFGPNTSFVPSSPQDLKLGPVAEYSITELALKVVSIDGTYWTEGHGPVVTFQPLEQEAPFLIATGYTSVESIGVASGHQIRYLEVYYPYYRSDPESGTALVGQWFNWRAFSGFDDYGWCASGCRP